jgi:hypothetical protein
MNDAFGITYKRLQPKLFLSAGPSATKRGPDNSLKASITLRVFSLDG